MEAYEKLNSWMCYKWMNFNHDGYSLDVNLGQTILSFLGCHFVASVLNMTIFRIILSVLDSYNELWVPFSKQQVKLFPHQGFLWLSYIPKCHPEACDNSGCWQSPDNIMCQSPDLRHLGPSGSSVLLFLISTWIGGKKQTFKSQLKLNDDFMIGNAVTYKSNS